LKKKIIIIIIIISDEKREIERDKEIKRMRMIIKDTICCRFWLICG